MMRQYFMAGLLLIISSASWAAGLELAKPPVFVNQAAVSLEVIPPPPAQNSLEEKRDIAILMWEQSTRTFYDKEHAWGGATLEPSYFNEALGVRFEESRFPKLYQLMKTVLNDAKIYTDAFKIYYKRPRPYDANANVMPFIPVEESYSYPSGHGTRGMTSALVLAELFPRRQAELIKMGLRTGQDRVIGGVHYPSDIEASVQLSEVLAKSIFDSPSFKAQVQNAQDEIARIQEMQSAIK